MRKTEFSQKLIIWYRQNKRDLPWRNTSDPYKIWLSEIILQQTRISQGLPYYLTFIEKYPTLSDLAQAPEDETLRLWQGLGYYSRARNMLNCAKTLQSEYGGRFPQTYDELRKLKGVGAYTAAAIASFSYKQRTAVVDGNVYRALSRIFGVHDDITTAKGKRTFSQLANELIPEEAPDQHNQAIMEFGALQCTAKNPRCGDCPFSKTCYAHLHDKQHALPVKSKKPKSRNRTFHYIVIRDKEAIWMRKRKEGDIWSGLYDFMLVEHGGTGDFSDLRDRFPDLDFQLVQTSEWRRHILTHQNIHARFYVVKASVNARRMAADRYHLAPYSPREAADLPKPILIANFLNELRF